MPPFPVIAFACPSCNHLAVCRKPDLGYFAECPHCRYRTRRPAASPFGRRAWDTCTDAQTLRQVWHAAGHVLTERKALLVACGLARVGFDWCRNVWFREAVAFGEARADGERHARGDWEISSGLLAIGENRPMEDWGRLAWEFLRENPRDPVSVVGDEYRSVVVGVYHDLLPNPFVPVWWSPDWLTSTVRDLAAHLYASRDFSAMPILADALMDAGCDHQLVQEHCRSARPHTRGCWVADAILGKT